MSQPADGPQCGSLTAPPAAHTAAASLEINRVRSQPAQALPSLAMQFGPGPGPAMQFGPGPGPAMQFEPGPGPVEEARHLRGLFLANIDLVQEQQEILVIKERTIRSLRAENQSVRTAQFTA